MENLLTISLIPVFLIFVLLEYFYLKKKNQSHIFRFNDAITNLNIGVGHLLTRLFTGFILIGAYTYFYNIAPIKLPENIWTWIACFFLYDFFFYWAHRWGHEVNLFWAAHSVHHQSEDYNLSVALRQSWLHALLAFVIFLPVPFMGMPAEIFFINAAISGLYQFWIHTETIHKMPKWFEYIFNTPSHHRVHHAINPKYIDRNHAGMFMIWDRLFGTFQAEDENEKIRYGITKTFGSWNPAWANVHFYTELWDKMKLVDGIGAKLALIFRKPGWNPVSMQEDVILPPSPDMLKYDKDTKSSARIYAVVQFGIVLIGSVMFLVKYPTLTLPYKLLFAGLIIFSIEVIGGLFENKKWAIYGEYLRLAAILLGLNWFYYFQYPNWLIYTLVCSLVLGLLSMIVYRIIQTSPVSNSRSVA